MKIAPIPASLSLKMTLSNRSAHTLSNVGHDSGTLAFPWNVLASGEVLNYESDKNQSVFYTPASILWIAHIVAVGEGEKLKGMDVSSEHLTGSASAIGRVRGTGSVHSRRRDVLPSGWRFAIARFSLRGFLSLQCSFLSSGRRERLPGFYRRFRFALRGPLRNFRRWSGSKVVYGAADRRLRGEKYLPDVLFDALFNV